jgi:hypothetical protein
MSDDQLNLSVLNRRTVIAAVRSEAARAGLDAEPLLDSARFYNAVTALDVDSPDFPRRVREMVSSSAGVPSAQPAPAQPTGQAPAAQPAGAQDGNRQWTDADVAALPNTRQGAKALQDAMDAGLLTNLGCGSRKRRR